MEGLSQGKYDMIIARKHMADPKGYSFHLLAEDRLAAVLPDSHPLAKMLSISPAARTQTFAECRQNDA